MEKKISFNDFIKKNIFGYILSVVLAIIGVLFSIAPFVVIYKLLLCLSKGKCAVYDLIIYSSIIFIMYILELLCHYLSTAISHKIAFALLQNIRLAVTKKLLKMPLGYTKIKGSGYFKDMIIDQIEQLEYPLAHAIPETISSVLMPVIITGLLFFMDWRIALAAVVPATLTMIFYLPMYLGIMNDFVGTYYSSLTNMNGKVIEYITGIKEIKIFGRAKDAYSQYEKSIDYYRDSTLRLYNKMYFVTSPAFVLLSSILVSVLCVGGLLYCGGNLSFSMYLFAIIISMGIGTPLLKFTEFMDRFFNIKNGKNLVDKILSESELLQPEKEHIPINGYEICFNNVSFAYEKKTIINNISLVFRENQKTALVGPSGSGKTTIANLIARFWDINSGSITLGGINYKDISLNQLMENVNYVTQETFLFNMSIWENIKVGNPNATDEEVIEAARAAQCDDFITTLDNGYSTIAGDSGTKLSGGECQRIIIARAILRNSPILILDEATTHADMENQHKIQESLCALCKNKTLIIIAHRLPTIVDCDQIIVIKEGKIIDCGKHEILLKNCSLYKNMWDIHTKSANWSINNNMEVNYVKNNKRTNGINE